MLVAVGRKWFGFGGRAGGIVDFAGTTGFKLRLGVTGVLPCRKPE